MPKDFPIPSITGTKSAISNLNFLTTPTTNEGAYAIATKGLNVVFFVKSPRFIVGFRELSDAKSNSFPSGTPRYAYLEQKQLKDRKSTRLNSSHIPLSRMPSSA